MTPEERVKKLFLEVDDVLDPEGEVGQAVKRAIKEAIAEEREACAMAAERAASFHIQDKEPAYEAVAAGIANSIRAREATSD